MQFHFLIPAAMLASLCLAISSQAGVVDTLNPADADAFNVLGISRRGITMATRLTPPSRSQ